VVSDWASRELYDQRRASLSIAKADVVQALADANQVRVSLGLQVEPEDSAGLEQVPSDLDQTFSSILQAQADLIQAAAQLGVVHSYNQSPKQMLEEFAKLGPVDRRFDQLAAEAPAVKQAEAKLEAAKRDLAVAELDLRYGDVLAEIDGVITRRNVNAGNDIQVGQSLMAIRSLSEIWIDANFKETQLRELRIGQAADLYVDMYGDKQVFSGRVTGFTMGTGSTLALLPPQNATGNYIKIVQRLPVRIELEGYDPDKKPLFIGASVVPYIYLDKPLSGPNAGTFLQGFEQQPPGTVSAAGPPGAGK
jgi:membrane fusion protein, multidrug efflux system